MRNRKKAAIAAAIAVTLLAACSARPAEGVSSGEIVVPEMSSEDLLVTSLEYLLENEEEEQKTQEQQPEEQKEQDVAQQPENEASQSGDVKTQSGQEEEQAEESVLKEKAVIYYGKGDFSELLQETIEIEKITPDGLIGALARHNIVPLLDTKVLSFEAEEEDGKKILRLDISKAFGEYLRTMSKEAECIIVASLANTFLENYGADYLYLTVEGDTLATTNAEYIDALTECTPDGLLEMIDATVSEADDQQADIQSDEEAIE